jgi:hypothetical protein
MAKYLKRASTHMIVPCSVKARTELGPHLNIQPLPMAGREFDPATSFVDCLDVDLIDLIGRFRFHDLVFRSPGSRRAAQAFCLWPSLRINSATITTGLPDMFSPMTGGVVTCMWD